MLRSRFLTYPPDIPADAAKLSADLQEEIAEKFNAMVAILLTYHPTLPGETAKARVRATLYTTYPSLGACDGPIEYDGKRARVLERVQQETETLTAMGRSIEAGWSMKDILGSGGEDEYEENEGELEEVGEEDDDEEEAEEQEHWASVAKNEKRRKGGVLVVGVNQQVDVGRRGGFTVRWKGTETE